MIARNETGTSRAPLGLALTRSHSLFRILILILIVIVILPVFIWCHQMNFLGPTVVETASCRTGMCTRMGSMYSMFQQVYFLFPKFVDLILLLLEIHTYTGHYIASAKIQ